MKTLLSGNEAIARGAYECGVTVAAAYPGTPSTEILENITQYTEIYSEWASNEKVALDVAIGAAYTGQRAMAAMKHVGLNVASESLFYSSYTGVGGGLVIVTADDPGLHSSQNEQDNRQYARFAKVPMLEPADSQECKDFVGLAFQISEQFDVPVLLRTMTRISHSKSLVSLSERVAPNGESRKYVKNPAKYVMIPGFAKRRHPVVEERMLKLAEFAETFPYNRIEMGDPALGIVAASTAYQYAREIFPGASFLRLGMSYPFPDRLIREFAGQVKRLVVVEELDPFIEEHIRVLGIPVEGKSIFPLVDELLPEVVRKVAHKAGLVAEPPIERQFTKAALPMRPPILCAGCGHRNVFVVLRSLKLTVNSDIGCYALGVLPPLGATDTIGAMGASIGVAHGMRVAGLEGMNVAVIGDSTFFHAGLPALANVVYNNNPVVTIISDNRTTGMTGHQGNPASGLTLGGDRHPVIELEPLVKAMGVGFVRTVDPANLDEFEQAIKDAIAAHRPAVVIARAPCVFVAERQREAYSVEPDTCNGCAQCMRIGCPAIYKVEAVDEKTGYPRTVIDSSACVGCAACHFGCVVGGCKASIDPAMCTGCGLCFDVCARQAIIPGEPVRAPRRMNVPKQ